MVYETINGGSSPPQGAIFFMNLLEYTKRIRFKKSRVPYKTLLLNIKEVEVNTSMSYICIERPSFHRGKLSVKVGRFTYRLHGFDPKDYVIAFPS